MSRTARALGVPRTASERLLDRLAGGGGTLVQRLFHRAIALVSLVAWISLAVQVEPLLGARGLLPAAPFVRALRAQEVGFFDAPTWLAWTSASDAWLAAGSTVGVALSLLALAGLRPRACLAASTALYLGFVVAGRTFFSFQWDILLIECGALTALLPRFRNGRVARALLRVLLFKLYFESGLAKLGSPLGDWIDGSAMTFYYETAPLPTRLAHLAHAMPDAWHHLESWSTLALELGVPLLIFGGRRARLVAAAAFTGFQIVNLATANYGFFVYLALALHLLLFDERDVRRARAAIERRLPRLRAIRAATLGATRRLGRWRRAARRHLPFALGELVPRATRRTLRRAAIGAIAIGYVAASLAAGLAQFAGMEGLADFVAPLEPFRVVNNYHLFAAITRERIEPALETSDGERWTRHDLRFKPGDPSRAPRFVAPHQPRLDFQLWFYGLSFRRGAPAYVQALLERACADPAAIQSFFPEPLPAAPEQVRMSFARYRFTSRDELARTGRFWSVEPLGAAEPLRCR